MIILCGLLALLILQKAEKTNIGDNGKDVSEWADWSIHSESDARAIEEHFLDKGMRGDAEGGSIKYVYIF